MKTFLIFMLGSFFGGIVGVVTMCFMQVGSQDITSTIIKDEEDFNA